jgi:transposase
MTFKIYHELPKIESKKQELESHIFNKIKRDSPQSLDIVFYDLTSSHFEGTKCSLGRPGITKDHGFKSHKITLSLIVTQDGLPFSWDVLPGDTPQGVDH